MISHELFSELNEKQLDAVRAIDGPVLVLAGAGSGKTKTLTHRIAYLILEKGIQAENILAVTFTNKAAGQMREMAAQILGKNPNEWLVWKMGAVPAIGTFHSICSKILRQESELIGFKKSFVIYDTSDQKKAVKNAMHERGVSTKDVNPSSVLGMISMAKNDLLSPEQMMENARGPIEKIASDIYNYYQSFLRDNNAMDFDDLIFNCVSILRSNKNVLSQYQNLWKYIMIDEYQDTNHAQYELARLLCGDRRNIFVVGDDWQGIYSWRGANIRNILEFEKDYKGAKVIRLEQNYRSTDHIVELGNLIISSNFSQMKKKLWTKKKGKHIPEAWLLRDEIREAEKILEKVCDTEGISESFGSLAKQDSSDEIVYDYESEGNSSPGGILDRIIGTFSKKDNTHGRDFTHSNKARHLSDVIPFDIGKRRIEWNKYAVLYRTNAQSRAIEEVLLKYGVPYQIVGGIRFYERKEIKDTLAYLRLLLNPNDFISMSRIINEPARGIGDKTLSIAQRFARGNGAPFLESICSMGDDSGISAQRLHNLKSFANIFISAVPKIEEMSIPQIIDLVLKKSGYLDALSNSSDDCEERMENIEELKNVAKKFEFLKGAEALENFLEEVSLIADIDSYDDNSKRGITLMTLHSAKGLEFNTVFLVGLEEGLLPHLNSLSDPEQLEEERRLCYVGITRAQERLFLFYTAQRALRGSIMRSIPSRFLSEISGENIEFFEDNV